MRYLSFSIFCIFLLSGCTEIMPWEKDILAKKTMSIDGYDSTISKINEHIYTSKEGSKGGSIGGGGCGCN